MSIEEDDDKAIKIDEDEDDSDNDKFEEIFQYQKKSNNRPESKRGRPESANTEKIT